MEEKKDKNGNVISPAGCYYLVKNSWGSRWKPAAGTLAKTVASDSPFMKGKASPEECDRGEQNGKFVYVPPEKRCNPYGGYFLMSEKDLLEHTYDATTIE